MYMRHLFSYDSDGILVGTHSYQQAGVRGWPAHYECDNPDSQQPDTRAWLGNLKTKPTGGLIFYECEHPGVGDPCACAADRQRNYYVEDGKFAALPVLVVELDGAGVEADGTVSRPVGAKLAMRISCEAPIETVKVEQSAQPQLLATTENNVEVAAVDGVAAIDVWAPAQGMMGTLRISCRRCRSFRFNIRGWGS